MTGRARVRGQGRSPGFLGGPAVAALFRAVRQGAAAQDKLPRTDFALPPGVSWPVEVKI